MFRFTLPVYTADFALEKNFEELVGSRERGEGEAVGLILIGIGPALPVLHSEQGWNPKACLEQIMAVVRQHLKKGDMVLEMGADQFAVLLVADSDGIHATLDRLKTVLTQWAAAKAGVPVARPLMVYSLASYPVDGMEAKDLIAKARTNLQQQLKVHP
jgi:hypothetical protein